MHLTKYLKKHQSIPKGARVKYENGKAHYHIMRGPNPKGIVILQRNNSVYSANIKNLVFVDYKEIELHFIYKKDISILVEYRNGKQFAKTIIRRKKHEKCDVKFAFLFANYLHNYPGSKTQAKKDLNAKLLIMGQTTVHNNRQRTLGILFEYYMMNTPLSCCDATKFYRRSTKE